MFELFLYTVSDMELYNCLHRVLTWKLVLILIIIIMYKPDSLSTLFLN